MSKKRNPVSTAKQIKALGPDTRPYVHSIVGSRGLYIKVHPSGQKSWYYRYRVGSKYEWMVLGEFTEGRGGMSLSEARDEFDTQRKITRKYGSAKQYRENERDENIEKLKSKREKAKKDAYTVTKLCEEYVEEASREIKSWAEVDRSLKKYVLPRLGEMAASEVTRKDVIAMLEPLDKAGKTVQSNRTLAYLRRAYNWGIGKDKFDIFNPCDRIEKNKERSKDRALADTEIKRLIKNLPGSGMSRTQQDLLMFILLTGVRPGEAAGALFNQIDEEARTLTLTNTKNGSTHIVPLSPPAFEIAIRRRKKSRWLFPSETRPSQPTRGDRIQSPLRRALPNLKVMTFTPHDLRRTFATGLARLQAPRLIISLSLNHSVPGVTGTYDRHGYTNEVREWTEKWGSHVMSLGIAEEVLKVG